MSNIFMKKIIFENEKVINELDNNKTLNEFNEINTKNKSDIKIISSFMKNTKFNEDLNLFFNKEELSLVHDYVKEFLNIEYIKFLNPFES